MTPEKLAEDLVPIAAELVGTVRDYGPDDVAAVLARVPGGRHDALAVVLAAMVDPDARPKQLLAWTELGPVNSRDFSPSLYNLKDLDERALGRTADRRAEVARLSSLGLSVREIAERLELTPRSVVRHRAAIRHAQQAVA